MRRDFSLEKEVVECFRRRDKQLAKQMKEKRIPEAAVSPPTETTCPMPSTISFSSSPIYSPTLSTNSQTDGKAKDGTICAKTSSGPDVAYIFSILHFSSEEVNSAQQDDISNPISPSTHQNHNDQPPWSAVLTDQE